MRTAVLTLAVLAGSIAASAQPQTGTAAEIAAIEQAWGEAFLKRDEAYLQSLVAPEFKLMGGDDGQIRFTPRAEWFANTRRFIFHEYRVRTVDVVAAGDTAVATVEGRWKVGMQGREGTRDMGFVVSDTFVRRGGRWQVIFRHSTSFPPPPPPTVPVETNERGGQD